MENTKTDGLKWKVKLNYMQGVGDSCTRLLFKFRNGTKGLNEQLQRHRGENNE